MLLMCIITVACTAMIYASLKTIPRWHNQWVLPVYLAFALSSGGLLLALVMAWAAPAAPLGMVLIMLIPLWLLAWALKQVYWRFIDDQPIGSDTGTATGLGANGAVRQTLAWSRRHGRPATS